MLSPPVALAANKPPGKPCKMVCTDKRTSGTRRIHVLLIKLVLLSHLHPPANTTSFSCQALGEVCVWSSCMDMLTSCATVVSGMPSREEAFCQSQSFKRVDAEKLILPEFRSAFVQHQQEL